MKVLASALLMGALLVGCGGHSESTTSGSAQVNGSGVTFDNNSVTLNRSGLPAARIGADGSLRIAGKPVALNAAQQQAMRGYYAQLQAVAKQGIEIGTKGAAFGAHAAGEALKGVLSGNPDPIGEKIEAEADTFKQHALQICDRLVGLRTAQDAAASLIPAFAPYASLTQHDVEDCRK
ncbi:DUF2884 family protein [Xanthomonas campestris pv. campestris]|nr:DUF2884 family protein [Xanthomonas campestris pv. campestris]